MKPDRRALIFSTVWPEPDSSAAGVRQLQWIRNLKGIFDEVVLISPSKVKEEGDRAVCELPSGVVCLPLPMNDWKVREVVAGLNPELVLFDRFILEEQFGPLVCEAAPDALMLLETQDLHLVRRARESMREKWLGMDSVPEGFYRTGTALRETAAIERVDHAFVVSSFETELLAREFSIGTDRQTWIPFGFDPPVHGAKLSAFAERKDFCWVGNFRHAPNADALRWVRKEIWPLIRKALPDARFHVFGAYPTAEFMDWNRDPSTGIRVHGAARDLDEVFGPARVNLAPLRFGAGVKGKILEGFRYGLPVATTPVGAEGLLPWNGMTVEFPGEAARDPSGIARAAVRLHSDENLWNLHRASALQLMNEVYPAERVDRRMGEAVSGLLEDKRRNLLPRWQSRVLRHELLNSKKYFSKWIEEKEKRTTRAPGDPC